MDLNNIKTFLQVVDSGSVAKAAKVLRYAPSTVSVQIQSLERELNFPLFERIGRRNHLTAEGREFLQYANDLQNIMKKVSLVGHESREAAFSLRVGVLQSLLYFSVLDVIPKFREMYPNAQLSLKLGNTLELREMLRKNQLDMVYISAPLNNDPSLTCLYTEKIDIVFAAGEGHELVGRSGIPLEEVMQYPFVLSDPSGQSYQIFRELAAETGKGLQCPVCVNDNTAISILLRDNRSLSFLPRPVISSQHTEGLVALDVSVHIRPYYSQVLVRESTWVSPVIDFLLKLIKEKRLEDQRSERRNP